MKLFGPAFGGVEAAEEKHHEGGELDALVVGDGMAFAGFCKDCGGGSLGTRCRIAVIQSVVGESAAQGMEKFVTRLQRLQKVFEGMYVDAGGLRQMLDPGQKFGVADGERFVGTEGRQDLRGQVRFRNRLMMAEIIGGVVGGADDFNVEFLKNSLRCQALESSVGVLPDGRRGFLVEQVSDAEVALQFEMRPVVKRIAQCVGYGACPGEKFFVGRGVASDVLFRNAVRSHGAPFIVVALQPDFEKVGELPIFRNVSGRKMTVVVEDGLRGGELVIKTPCGVVGQKEIFAEKAVHICKIVGRAAVWLPSGTPGTDRRFKP